MQSETMMITSAAALAFLPGVAWMILWYKKDKKEPEPKRMVALAFVRGMLAAIPLVVLFYLLPMLNGHLTLFDLLSAWSPLFSMVAMTVSFAFFEEFLKGRSVLKTGKYIGMEFNQIIDGVVYAVATGLGFAVIENLFYFLAALKFYDTYSLEFLGIVAFRSFGTMLAHSMFSGLFGLLWGHAFLSPSITGKHIHSVRSFFRFLPRAITFHITLRHIFESRPSKHKHEKAQLVCEGLLLATILHSLFNLLLQLEICGKMLTPLVVPLLLGLLFFIAHQFMVKKNIEIMKPVVET